STIAYPAAGAHQADPCGPEPPTGYRIDDLGPDFSLAQGQEGGAPSAFDVAAPPTNSELGPVRTSPVLAQATPNPASAPIEPAGLGSFPDHSGDPTSEVSVSQPQGRVGSPPHSRLRRF